MAKAISEVILSDDVRYTHDHEWAREENGDIKVGITDYAQDQLGDIVFAELPEVGSTFENGEVFGTLESVKAVSELFIPIGGEIVAINEALAETPDLVNTDPYGNGWMILVKPKDAAEFASLKDKAAYMEILKGLE